MTPDYAAQIARRLAPVDATPAMLAYGAMCAREAYALAGAA